MWEGGVAEFGVWSLVINQGAAIGEAVFSRLASIDTVCRPLHPLHLPAFLASRPEQLVEASPNMDGAASCHIC